MAKKSRRYTPQERARILSAAKSEGLTGKPASQPFGVSEVTLWKWRRDSKSAMRTRRPRAVRPAASNGSIALLVRTEVQARVREMVPAIIREEIAQVFGSKRQA